MDDAVYNEPVNVSEEETPPVPEEETPSVPEEEAPPVPEEKAPPVSEEEAPPVSEEDVPENGRKAAYRPRRLSEDQDIVSKFTTELYDWIQTIVSSLILVSLVFAFAARIIGVSGPSMQDTLFTDEKVLISHLFYTPKQGDVVVFTKKDIHLELNIGSEDEPLVKRIIALEGQTVDVDFDTGEVRVDGDLLDEPYIKEPAAQGSIVKLSFPFKVPPGTVFVMGDNRNRSSDSRMFGPVDKRYILGQVLLRVWPLSKFGPLNPGRDVS